MTIGVIYASLLAIGIVYAFFATVFGWFADHDFGGIHAEADVWMPRLESEGRGDSTESAASWMPTRKGGARPRRFPVSCSDRHERLQAR